MQKNKNRLVLEKCLSRIKHSVTPCAKQLNVMQKSRADIVARDNLRSEGGTSQDGCDRMRRSGVLPNAAVAK